GYRVYMEDPVSQEPGRDVVVQVDKNMSSSALGSMLEDKGLVRDGTLFMIQLKLSAYSDKIMPGIYTLNTSMTPREMIEIMAPVEVEQ
ncbi:MAG: endolytic transglycosylase MltG, partial [Lachnospiraceae bacterium]|nr:endolytic transglycosylase MltG [Lachnospiraceae bacterium]